MVLARKNAVVKPLTGWIDNDYCDIEQEFAEMAPQKKLLLLYKEKNTVDNNESNRFLFLGCFAVDSTFDNQQKIIQLANENRMSEFVWRNLKVLHVHHQYYRDGWNPWEYPNDALKTLCWKCHETLHKDAKVPRLNKDGVDIGSLTPCYRCYGAGWFPEYKHVEAGICFRCRGAKYEELIDHHLP